jgi:hypothetical protein
MLWTIPKYQLNKPILLIKNMEKKTRIVTKEVEEVYYVASDGLEFTNQYLCKEHDDKLCFNKYKIDFEYNELDGNEFDITYHENLRDKFAQCMHTLLYDRYGANRTGDAYYYTVSKILSTIEDELDAKLIDNHRYKFEAYTNYVDDDHDDEFVLYVEDLTREEQIPNIHDEFVDSVLNCSSGIQFKETLNDFITHNYKNTDKKVIKQALCDLVDNCYKDK